MIQNNRILKNIAKEWCKGILLSCETNSFDDAIEEGYLTEEEASYIVEEAQRIAIKISKEPPSDDINDIIKKYYELE